MSANVDQSWHSVIEQTRRKLERTDEWLVYVTIFSIAQIV